MEDHQRRHTPRAEHRARRGDKLGLRELSAMATGGIIGGEIFRVLGLTISLAGHLAFPSFALVAVIAAQKEVAFATAGREALGTFGFWDFLLDTERSAG